jgi:uncharacterized membrane protein YhhN
MNERFSPRWFVFLIFVVADIICLNEYPSIRFFTKPFLIPALIVAYHHDVRPLSVPSRLFIAALVCSWLGDVLLMLEARDPIFFIGGLLAFLSAHLLYIWYFKGIISTKKSFLKSRPVMLLAVVVFVFELIYILWPGLGAMKIPVIVYASVIGTMLAFALWQYGKIDQWAALLFISGALLFVLSDSLLAINRFRIGFKGAGTWVMITYCLAQFLLAKGSVRHLRQNPSQD